MISVVVITYNSSATVIETLDSIYNQTYKDIELIITDDGSKDNTVGVCKEWLVDKNDRFSNVIVLENENEGVSRNCNRGIEAANGEYIQIIAGDDLLRKEAFEKKYKFATEHHLNVTFCKIHAFGEDNEQIEKIERYCNRGYEIIRSGYKIQKKKILINNCIAGPSGGFFDSNYIKGIGGYDEKYPMIEDYPFIYHYIYSGNEIIMMDDVLVDYRVSRKSLSQKPHTPMMKSYASFFFKERFWQMLKEGKIITAVFQTFVVIAKYYLLNAKIVWFITKRL